MPKITHFIKLQDPNDPFAGSPRAVYGAADLRRWKKAAKEAGVRYSVREATENDLRTED